MTDTNDIAAPIDALATATIAAIDAAVGQWTGLDWSDSEIDAIDVLIEYAEAQTVDDEDAHQLVAPDEDVIDAAYHRQADGSHTEQQLSDRSRRAVYLYEQAESASEWRDALDELTAVRDELVGAVESDAESAEAEALEARELLCDTPTLLSDAEQALRLLGSACSTERQYGDDPTWRAAREACEALVEALQEADDEADDSDEE